MTKEQERVKDIAWKKWGPYVSDRQWGLSAKTIVKTAIPGITLHMTWHAAKPIAEARRVLAAFVMMNNNYVLR